MNTDLDTIDAIFSATGTSVAMNIDGANIDSSPIGANTASTGAFTSLSATGDLTVDTSTLKVDSTNNRVGIGSASPDTMLHVHKATAGSVTANSNTQLTIENNDHAGLGFLSPNDANSIIYFGDVDDNDVGYINYAHASNSMNFQTNASLAMTIDSSQKVGIGTASPTGNLDIKSSSSAYLDLDSGTNLNAGLRLYENDTFKWQLYNDGDQSDKYTIDHATGTALVIDQSGSVGIGNTLGSFHSSVLPLIVGSGSGDEGMAIFSGSSSKGKIGFADAASDDSGSYRGYFQYDHSGDNLNIGTAGSERMRVTSAGELLVGSTSWTDIDGASSNGVGIATGRIIITAASGSNVMEFNTNGTGNAGEIAISGGSTTYSTSSDYRLKDVKGSIQNGLERTLALNPVEFEWKADGTISEGFIAHEAQEIFADAVTGEKDGEDMQGMDYGRITPLLVKAIQELSAEVEQLKQQAHEKCEN